MNRFASVGPLYPQNFQLIDITGEKMRLIADMPIGIGEPHYSQMIKTAVSYRSTQRNTIRRRDTAAMGATWREHRRRHPAAAGGAVQPR